VQFISNRDIHPDVQNDFPVDHVLKVDMHILAFLSVSPFLEPIILLIY